MSSNLHILTELKGDYSLVTATVQPGGTLPIDIFVYENNGTNVLGDFYGTCSVDELGRLQTFTGEAIPTFGNRFYKYGQAKIKVSLEDDTGAVITSLVKNVSDLSKALQTKISVSSTYPIP